MTPVRTVLLVTVVLIPACKAARQSEAVGDTATVTGFAPAEYRLVQTGGMSVNDDSTEAASSLRADEACIEWLAFRNATLSSSGVLNATTRVRRYCRDSVPQYTRREFTSVETLRCDSWAPALARGRPSLCSSGVHLPDSLPFRQAGDSLIMTWACQDTPAIFLASPRGARSPPARKGIAVVGC